MLSLPQPKPATVRERPGGGLGSAPPPAPSSFWSVNTSVQELEYQLRALQPFFPENK